ncbi:Crp/Fnr family transcriptional regulator [Zarconia navalis]|uniref:Crp/Fnr family transcriptional regulator n=1 Tax=Zarconia navalis TaxID=2992134 RepID=UPI0021F8AF37|nr:Crp/Fnr family transcriptional regulator [Zarconia navalis]
MPLSLGQVLYEPKDPIEYAYFPHQAMVSLVSIVENGATTEIGLVGNQGMVGLPILWGGTSSLNRAIVQVAGSAQRIRADIIKDEFSRGGELQKLLLLYTQALFTHTAQTAACNRQHTIEKRLARWLLSARDCTLSNDLLLTQEFIATMLGTGRSGVTIAAVTLQRAGMIRYSRGKITIIDGENLEDAACECYRVVKNEFQRLFEVERGLS